MSDAAVLPERVLLTEDAPSRFGGTRLRLTDGPRRFDPTTLTPHDDGIDVARWLSRPALPGAAQRGLALLRPLGGASPPTPPDGETSTSNLVWRAWCAALVARGCRRVLLLPRMAERAEALRVVAANEGLEVTALALAPAQPLLLIDDSELVTSVGWRTVADASHSAMLAAGLAADVVAALQQLGGADAADVWEKGFDDVAREVVAQRVERALRRASAQGPQQLSLSTLLPPLSASTSKLSAVRALADASPRALELAATLRQRQVQQWQAWASLRVELRAPSARSTFWTERLVDLELPPGRVWVVGAPSSSSGALLDALRAAGHVAGEPTPAWLVGRIDDDEPAAPQRPAPVAPRAVGGVRASGALLADVGEPVEPSPSTSSSPSPTSSTTPSMPTAHERAPIAVPTNARDVRVFVDGAPRDDFAVAPGAVGVPSHVRWGSIILVTCDDDAPESAS